MKMKDLFKEGVQKLKEEVPPGDFSIPFHPALVPPAPGQQAYDPAALTPQQQQSLMQPSSEEQQRSALVQQLSNLPIATLQQLVTQVSAAPAPQPLQNPAGSAGQTYTGPQQQLAHKIPTIRKLIKFENKRREK